jgi:hypothetical protein
MFKSCFDILVKDNIKKVTRQNVGPTHLSKPSINIIHEREYRDIQYSSCKTCDGSGFVEKCLGGNENTNKNNLEKTKKTSPYKICIACHGTGKNDSETVFFYTCCQNKNRT